MEEIKLINYLPPVLQRVEEFKAICDSEDPEFEQARRAFLAVCKNLFVTTAGEDGVLRFEKELGITAGALDTLEARKARIIALKSGGSFYTMRWLEIWVSALNGPMKPTFVDYSLRVVLPAKCDYRSLFDTLLGYIPANMRLIEGVMLSSANMQLYTGAAVRFSMKRTIEGEPAELSILLADENGVILTDENGNSLIL